jgi:tRNA threonylcarbamoyladenosine biosynthesis protein TsaB
LGNLVDNREQRTADLLVNRLIIENSSPTGGIVLATDRSIVLEQSFQGSAELATLVDSAVKGIGKLDEIVVGIGPGSYTGLRVAIATALGIKLAIRCRTVGCPSVLGYPEENYLVVGDARRGTCFLAEIRDGEMRELPRLVPKAEIAAEVAKASGQQIYATAPIIELGAVQVVLPQARYLLGRENSYQELQEPIYLKEPHITRPG